MLQLKPVDRIQNLDYFRGIAACSIMLYHFLFWNYGKFYSEELWGRIGIYGVSVFYILSGLTMCVVYQDKITTDVKSIIDFFLKRVVRIFPLLWLAITLSILIHLKQIPRIETILLNYTGLFGFVKPWDYIGNGVWSIGNELVFYVFFPVFVLSYKLFKSLFYVIIGLGFFVLVYFAFYKFDTTSTLEAQWKTYVNPFNQIHLFLGGYLIGLFFRNISIPKIICRLGLLTSLLLFYFYPVSGDRINIISENNKLVFTFICFIMTISIYKDNYQIGGIFKRSLLFLGEASYSIYLLHHFVFYTINGISIHFLHLNRPVIISISVMITFLLAFLVYSYFEKPAMEKGRLIIRKMLFKN